MRSINDDHEYVYRAVIVYQRTDQVSFTSFAGPFKKKRTATAAIKRAQRGRWASAGLVGGHVERSKLVWEQLD